MRAPATTPDKPNAEVAAAGPGQADPTMRAMRAVLARQGPASAAEALQLLRRGYPDTPLKMRVAALCAGSK